VGAVLADGDLAEIFGGLPQRDEIARLDEAEREVIERRRGALELARVADGARRLELAGLDAEAAVHAFAHVDVEAAHRLLLRRRVLHEVDRDALDRAGALAALAARADVHLHLEEAAVARGEHLRDGAIRFVGILDGDRLPEKMGERHRHALEGRPRGAGDALDVLGEIHAKGAPEAAGWAWKALWSTRRGRQASRVGKKFHERAARLRRRTGVGSHTVPGT
jgi:hypothetical protein